MPQTTYERAGKQERHLVVFTLIVRMQLLAFQLTVLASVVPLPGVLPQPPDFQPGFQPGGMGYDRYLYCSLCKAVVDEVLYALDPKNSEQVEDSDDVTGSGFGEIAGNTDESGVTVESGATGSEAEVSTPDTASDDSKPESAAAEETPVDQDAADALFNERLEDIISEVCGKTMENYKLIRSRGRTVRPKMGVKRITPFNGGGGEDVEREDMGSDEQTWDVFKAYCLSLTEENKKFMLEIFKRKHLTPHEIKVDLCVRTAEACKPKEVKDPNKKEPEEPKKSKRKRRRPRRKRPFRGGRGRRSSDRGRKRGRKSRRRSRRDVDEDEYDDDEEEWPRHRGRRFHSRDPDDDEDLEVESPDEEGLEEDSEEPLDHDELMRREVERRQQLEDELVSYGKSYKNIEEYREEYGEGVDEMEFFDDLRKRKRRRERGKNDGQEDEDDPSYHDDPQEEQEELAFQEEMKRLRAGAKKKKASRRKYDEL